MKRRNLTAGKRFGTLLLAFVLLALCACGAPAGEDAAASDPTAEPTPEATPEATPEPTPEPTPDPTEEPIPVLTEADYTIYVDAEVGDDTANGTADAPVQSVARAQELVRARVRGMEGDITVILSGGRHELADTIAMTQADGGCNGYRVIWTSAEEEEAVISGGTQITGWELHDAELNIWSAPANGITSRDFYVNGQSASIASYTETMNGRFYTKEGDEVIRCKVHPITTEFAHPEELELIINAQWQYSVVPLTDLWINEEGYLFMKPEKDAWDLLNLYIGVDTAANLNKMTLSNAYEFLTEPGTFYLSPTEDTIYYIPREGEDMATADAVLGRLEELITITGEHGAPVENITFTGLTFSHTTWLQPQNEEGFCVVQSNVYKSTPLLEGSRYAFDYWMLPDAAVATSYTNGVEFTNNTMTLLGSTGLDFGRATKNAVIEWNTFTDIAGTGITLGRFADLDHHPVAADGSNLEDGMLDLTEKNSICFNTVDNVGVSYGSSCGILVGYAADTVIEYNTICNLPYTGISFGWGWGYNKNEYGTENYYIREDAGNEGKFLLCNLSIRYNYIDNTMNVAYDGGGIYTLGRCDNAVIEGNYIIRMNNDYGAIYLDEGSCGFTVTGNVLVDCHRNYIYKGDYNYIFDNYTPPDASGTGDINMIVPHIDNQPNYRVENNQLWDEAAVAEILANAGVPVLR